MQLPKEFATDWIELLTAVVPAIGLGLTVYSIRDASARASRERKAALDQAREDLRWRQTVEAQAAVRRLLDDKRAFNAMTMLDEHDGQKFPVGAKPIPIANSDIVNAMQAHEPFNDPQLFIRAALDSLFNHFELIQQAIEVKIFTLKHVVFPLDYYVERMELINLESFRKYINENKFNKSDTLITDILDLKKKKPDHGV